MKISSFLVLAVFALLTFGLWAKLNRQTNEEDWPTERISGFSFQPFRSDQSSLLDEWPTEAQIDADLELLGQRAINIRTYSSRGTLASIPRLAAKYKLRVAMGAYLYADDPEKNEAEITGVIKGANENNNVIRIIVGNETLLENKFTAEELIPIIDRVKKETRKSVSTAEPWHVWLDEEHKYQIEKLADHVDYLAVHMLPYWEGLPVDSAVDYVVDKMERLRAKYPKKNIIITEVGWPSDGRTREAAVASTENEALFLRRFIHREKLLRLQNKDKGFTYYIMEAFDQPWKEQTPEGSVGAYWGVFDSNRQPKFPFVDQIERFPAWDVLAAISVVIAAILLGVFYLYSHTLQTRGRTFLAFVVYGTAIITVWIIYDYSRSYLSISTVLVGTLLVVGMLGVIAVLLAEAHEWAEARWVTSHKRVLAPGSVTKRYLPKVSVHVPAYNEPPDMLIETIDALANLDYPDYEVLVIDNNTKDEAVWRPVEAHCKKLGPKFRFFHVAPLAGFKAGALNYALRQTDSEAEVVAVIDSDYIVETNWLKDLVPAFGDARIAIVQAPQDYRDGGDNAFKAMCYAEYRGFFHIGMITRNERNAIIQHGTMTMVRRTTLEKLNGWAEWCITEDAELGMRIFEAGCEATYLPTSYGRGVMPDTFVDYKKQRFRWAYGAMQILRRHARNFLRSNKEGLSAGQRYHFIAGWLPWIADGFNFVFTLGALGWSLLMWLGYQNPTWFKTFEPPLLAFSILPLLLFTFKLVKLLHLYVTRVGANLRQTAAAALAGLALSHTIGMATLKGLVTRNEPFFRTPKLAKPHGFATAFASARTETVLMLLLWLSAFAVADVREDLDSPDRFMWTIMLLIQSLPYMATLLVSLASAFPFPARWLGAPPASEPKENYFGNP
jgi:exo-beta-1,3-glucanase (GH17 family)/cellulose synthase/poly-beta-1,6-N-acetylglucosamine synthase-like glycosyltransferase